MSTDTREALAAARSALGQLIEAGKAVKAALDATIPDGDPVHPESRRLTWPISSGLLALDAVDAALATQPAQPSAKPLKWSHAYADQWLDEDYGFSIMLETDSETPYSASWGEGDAEDFATLEAAQAWCQAEIDAWVRSHVVVTPAQPSAQGEEVAHPSHLTVREWMPVNEALRLADVWSAGDLDNCGQWRAAIKVLADEVRALASAPAAPAQAVPLTDEHVNAVVRSVQPYLSTECKAWRELTETCRYWLQAERGIAPKAAP